MFIKQYHESNEFIDESASERISKID